MLDKTKTWNDKASNAYIDDKPAWLDDKGDLIAGIYRGMTNADYHAIDAFSSSIIKDTYKTSLKEIHRLYFSGLVREQSASMTKGELVHEAILEPPLFAKRRFQMPEISNLSGIEQNSDLKNLLKEHGLPVSGLKADLKARIRHVGLSCLLLEDELNALYRKEAGEEALALAQELVKNKTVTNMNLAFCTEEVKKLCIKTPIEHELYNEVAWHQKQAKAHKVANQVIDYGESELSIVVFDEEFNTWVKCRFDYLSYDNFAADVKTAVEVSPQGFAKAVRNYRYDIQQAFYTRVARIAGIVLEGFLFVGIGTNHPKEVAVYDIDTPSIQRGENDMINAFVKLQTAIINNDFPGYADEEILTLSIWKY